MDEASMQDADAWTASIQPRISVWVQGRELWLTVPEAERLRADLGTALIGSPQD